MTKITLNIPDNELDFFLKLVLKFNYSISETDFELSDEQIAFLDKSSKVSIEDCISEAELKNSFKNKYAI